MTEAPAAAAGDCQGATALPAHWSSVLHGWPRSALPTRASDLVRLAVASIGPARRPA